VPRADCKLFSKERYELEATTVRLENVQHDYNRPEPNGLGQTASIKGDFADYIGTSRPG
jgi:hypothetical protein